MPIYLKTVYSFLTSLITIDELISFAKTNKFDSLCICDDNMYGVMEFIHKCNSNNIKPIVGLDIGICLLFAKNYQGYQSLMKISTILARESVDNIDLELYQNDLVCFVDENSSLKDELIKIFKDIYIYGKNSFPLHKTLCLKKEDTIILRYLNLLRDGKKISDDYSFDDDCYYLPIGNKQYKEFIDKCNLVLPKYKLNLPSYSDYNDTKGLNNEEYLKNLSIAGLNKRMDGKISNKYRDRLLYELDIIQKMGFSNYFLIVYDYIKYAKSHDILVGPGRGSAAGSLVSFSLGITDVDPIKYDLLFERFLNIERISMPDIDTDFPDDKRDEVITYVKNKYGEDHVSLIVTFNTFGSKMALRDMGRVMNIPTYIIDDLCRKIGNMTLLEAREDDNIKRIIQSDNKLKELYHIALRIEGIPRHSSIHAAGVIISGTPLVNTIPLSYDNNIYISSYESIYLEELGLLKMDFLGIRNLTIIDNTLKLINKYEKKTLKFNNLPLQDDKTNALFTEGDTSGIFQFESDGMKKFLSRLNPKSFEDIYNANAFYRPGPSNSIDLFLKRREKSEIDCFDERLKDILESTNGIIVYQEQIMQIANRMASFTLGEADILRRAMSKKKVSDIEKYHDKFVNNSIKNGYDKDIVNHIYDLILEFASYGFNKSHSVVYSMISYRMAYLKANYPLYFYVALLDSLLMDENKITMYIKEIKRKNIGILKPDINKSTNNFMVNYGKILCPLNMIKGISSDIVHKIISARETKFDDIYNFFEKISEYKFSTKVIETLIRSGALDTFGYNRNTLLHNMDNLINYGSLTKSLKKDFVLKPEIEVFSEYSKEELIMDEKECYGIYINNHPVSFYKNSISSINLVDIRKYFNKKVTCVLMIDKIREITTKNGEKMAFLNCSDEEKSIDITVFPKLYADISNLKKSDIIKVEGIVERRSDFEIVASAIQNVKEIL